MADKPYTERTGGSYVRDPQTGKLTQTAKAPDRPDPNEKPAPAAPAPVTDAPAKTAEKKDK